MMPVMVSIHRLLFKNIRMPPRLLFGLVRLFPPFLSPRNPSSRHYTILHRIRAIRAMRTMPRRSQAIRLRRHFHRPPRAMRRRDQATLILRFHLPRTRDMFPGRLSHQANQSRRPTCPMGHITTTLSLAHILIHMLTRHLDRHVMAIFLAWALLHSLARSWSCWAGCSRSSCFYLCRRFIPVP